MIPGEQYGELLRDPRWKKKRLEILARDQNRCARCGKSRAGMNVHHKQYLPGAKPWQVPASFLETLCPGCHRGHHAAEDRRAREREDAEFDRETFGPIPPPPQPCQEPAQPPAAQRSPEGVSAAGAEMPVGIYKITLGISTWVWLCVRHVAARREAGWACDRTGGAEWLTCDDCVREAQS